MAHKKTGFRERTRGFKSPKTGLIDQYLVLETTPDISWDSDLSDSEWRTVMAIFKNHPELVKIWAPLRDPEPERTPFSYSRTLKRIILGEDKDWQYILSVRKKASRET